MKIIPAIDLMDGQVVRLYKGDPNQKTIYDDDPIKVAKNWEDEGADMIHLVDLDATLERGSNIHVIKKILDKVSIPIQVAGGLRNESIINEILQISQRVVIGTLAFNDRKLLSKLLSTYGNKRIVISIDHNDGLIVTHGWQQMTNIQMIDALKDFLETGFTEFLLTNISRDGTLEGPDLSFLEQACTFKLANIIASGGISNIHDIKNIKKKDAFGVILGKALYENKISIKEAKNFS